MSELLRKFSIQTLKKINIELGNAIKTACDVSWESGGAGTEDSQEREQELFQVGGEMHNTETSVSPGLPEAEPSLKPASYVQTCFGDQDSSRENAVRGREHVSVRRVVDKEAPYDVEEGADEHVELMFEFNGNESAQAYTGDHVTE